MDQEQLRKAAAEGTEFEYLINDQWLPAIISHYHESSSHPAKITIQLLSIPPGHSGIVHLRADDMNHRFRFKVS